MSSRPNRRALPAAEKPHAESLDHHDEDDVDRATHAEIDEERAAPQPGARVALEHEAFERREGRATDGADNGAGPERAMRIGAIGSADEGAGEGGGDDGAKRGRGRDWAWRHHRPIGRPPRLGGSAVREAPSSPAKRGRMASPRQSPLPSWVIFAVATSSIMTRSSLGTGIGVQARSPSMKKTMPPVLPSTVASAALSP